LFNTFSLKAREVEGISSSDRISAACRQIESPIMRRAEMTRQFGIADFAVVVWS
jgi:hypothetical protein